MDQLPVDCICHILAFTSPKDVCRLAGVSSALKTAVDSDLLWKTFLPSDYPEIIARSPSPSVSSFLNSLSKKALYFQLSDHPLLIDTGNSSFSLEKESGSKCYMIGAKDLDILDLDSMNRSTPRFIWEQYPESRFFRVAKIYKVYIDGKIETGKLTPKTCYGAYFVFKHLIKSSLRLKIIVSYFEMAKPTRKKWTRVNVEDSSIKRGDGWMEVEIGKIFMEEDNDSVVFFISTVFCDGLIMEGVEIRPISTKGKNGILD